MPRKKSWKKAAVKKNACKADVGDKYPTDVGHVQPSVPLGVGHVLTPMTSVPAGVISTTPVTVVSAALPETTLTQTMPLAQTMPQMLPLAQTMPQMLPLAQTMPQMLPLAQMLPQMITQNSSQFLTQNISQITTQNITPFTMNNIPNETTHALQDQTLLKGDNLYNTVVKNLQSAGKLKSRLLMFDELPIHIDSGENHHMVDKFDTLFGLLVTDDKRNQIQTLHECLQQALGLSRLDQLTTTALTKKQSAGTINGHLKKTAIKKDKKEYMREYMRNKRQDPEFKDKERDSMRNKRQDPEFKSKEMDSMRNKRQDPEFKSKERNKFKGKERDSKRNKRQDPEFKSKERDSKRNKRQDPDFKDKERDKFKSKERDSMRNKRQDAEFKDKERDSKRYKRQEEEYRHDEQIRDLKKKKEMRQNSSQLEKERLKMKEKRKNEEYRSSENIAAKQSKAHSRRNLDYIDTEKQRYRKSKFGVDAIECVDNFHNNNEDSAMHDQSDESDSDEFCEVDSGKDGNRDILLDSDSYDMNQIFTFTPGERGTASS
ncbi:histone-lysine N-methyltransferase, H3 lysine-79 specific-like [Saccostrea cucullata]|uniref:histone-lysine N-methyltransferase, H3 lysine-79 specific-like n=1 Tax=Saccostrea cuccullata TaxID=36930 RepID=UPI002ED26E9E